MADLEVVAVPTAGPVFEKVLTDMLDAHASELPFFESKDAAEALARPLIAEFLARIKAAQS